MINQPTGERLTSLDSGGCMTSCCFKSPKPEKDLPKVKNVKIVLMKEYPHFVEMSTPKKVGTNKDLSAVF